MTPARREIGGLTPLRGVAALLVAAFHFQLFVAPLFPSVAGDVVMKFYLMVDLFFVLSGFVIMHVYGASFTTKIDRGGFVRYMRARFARIYPLHVATLAYVVALALAAAVVEAPADAAPRMFFTFDTIPLQLLMLHATWAARDAWWNTPSWSVSVEWWAYVVFPFIALGLHRRPRASAVVILVAAASGYWALTEVLQPAFVAQRFETFGVDAPPPGPEGSVDVVAGPALIRGLCAFALGTLTWKAWRAGVGRPVFADGRTFIAICALLTLGWATGLASDPVSIALFSPLLLCVANNDGRLLRALNAGPLPWLGRISYSLYLVHMPIIFTWSIGRAIATPDDPARTSMLGYDFSPGAAWAGFALFLPVLIAVSAATHYGIERPARRFLKPRAAEAAPGGAAGVGKGKDAPAA